MELRADWSNEDRPEEEWNGAMDEYTPAGRNEVGCGEDRLDGPKGAEPRADEGNDAESWRDEACSGAKGDSEEAEEEEREDVEAPRAT